MYRQSHEEVAAPSVVLLGPPSQLAVLLLEVAELVGVKVLACDDPDELPPGVDLALTLPGAAPLGADCPQVSVGMAGDDADICLPSQARLLAQLLSDPAVSWGNGGRKAMAPRLFVAGLQGGAGTSVVAERFALAAGALLLDASGHPPEPPGVDALHWGAIDASDPPLPTDLLRAVPRSGGVRRLGSPPSDLVGVGDPRVVAVAGTVPTPVVIDSGVWQPCLESAVVRVSAGTAEVKTVLALRGGRSSGLRLAGVLAAASPLATPHLILGIGRDLGDVRLVAKECGVEVACPPGRGTRAWRALWTRIWSP